MLNLVNLPGLRVAEEIYKAHFQRRLDQVGTDAKDRLFSWQTHKGQDSITGSAERKKVRPLGGNWDIDPCPWGLYFVPIPSCAPFPLDLCLWRGKQLYSAPTLRLARSLTIDFEKTMEATSQNPSSFCHSHPWQNDWDRKSELRPAGDLLKPPVLLLYAGARGPLTYRGAGAQKRTVSGLA